MITKYKVDKSNSSITNLNTLRFIHTDFQIQERPMLKATATLADILELNLPEKIIPESTRLIDILYDITALIDPTKDIKNAHFLKPYTMMVRKILHDFTPPHCIIYPQ